MGRVGHEGGSDSAVGVPGFTTSKDQGLRAPKEPRHVAWGVSPRDAAQPASLSPEGATAVCRNAAVAC